MTERAIIVGDSQAAGLIRHLQTLLPSIGIEIVDSFSQIGKQTIWFAREEIVKNLINRYHPDIVILIMGGNDAQRNIETWLPGVRNVVAQAKSKGARIIWIGTAFSQRADVQTRHARVANWQESALPHLNVTWINAMPMTQGGHSPDGVHFTRSGYRAWAEAITDELATLPSRFSWVPLLFAAAVGYLFYRVVR